MQTTESECIESLREAAELLGKSPTTAEYEELGLTPAQATIQRVMGSWNEAKEAAGLETFDYRKTGGTEVAEKPDWVDLPEDKEWEEMSGNQRWYYKNREKEIEKKNRRRKVLWRWLYEYKRDNCKCERCGEGNPACIDFHHPAEKDLGVSKMIAYGYSKESILEEIEQCTVLCSNCHRDEHYEIPNPVREKNDKDK